MKITDCHMNWEMEKLCWRIDEKKGRRWLTSLGTISEKFRSEFKFSYVRLAIFTIGHS
jgi:hypothetical protein